MNTNDLYLEYARVIQMCKGTDLEDTPWVCVRWRNKDDQNWHYCSGGHPVFGFFTSEHIVESAVAVLEGSPVFVGDAIYTKYGDGVIVSHGAGISMDGASWTPPTPHKPKRTFALNGVELPCPCKLIQEERCCYMLNINEHLFRFDNQDDKNACYSAIINLLTEARDK